MNKYFKKKEYEGKAIIEPLAIYLLIHKPCLTEPSSILSLQLPHPISNSLRNLARAPDKETCQGPLSETKMRFFKRNSEMNVSLFFILFACTVSQDEVIHSKFQMISMLMTFVGFLPHTIPLAHHRHSSYCLSYSLTFYSFCYPNAILSDLCILKHLGPSLLSCLSHWMKRIH